MKLKKNILFYYSHQHIDTGSPRALIGLLDLIDKKKYESFFLASGEGPLLEILRQKQVQIVKGKVSKILFRTILKNSFNIVSHLKLLRKLKIDLLHVNEFGMNLDLVLSAWLLRIPIVLHVHNPEDIKFYNLHWYFSQKVLHVSKAVLNAIENKYLINHKCSLVYNFADQKYINSGKNIRSILGFSSSDILIGIIAQITPEKGTDIAIETAKLLLEKTNLRLHFLFVGRIGENCEEFFEKMKELVKLYNIEDKIHFLGVRNNIPDILNSIDIFFLPTLAETFCLAILEAMMAALPIVASRVGAVPELINELNLGFLVDPPLLPEKFSAIISKILSTPMKSKDVGIAARDSLKNRLDKAVCSIQLQTVYDEILF